MKKTDKGSKMIGKINGSESRKDRHSGSGWSGSPKKGGYGGKFTWAGDGYSPAEMGWLGKEAAAADSKDPNFEDPDPGLLPYPLRDDDVLQFADGVVYC